MRSPLRYLTPAVLIAVRKQSRQVAMAAAVVCWLTLGTSVGQSDQGTIAGTVVDSSGAVVSGASVVVRGADTGSVYKTTTSGDGIYRVSGIAIGRYDVTVEAPGFKSSVQKGVLVQINTVAALNVALQPGSLTEEVTVLADTPTIQTESSDVGTVVGEKQIQDLPLALNSTGQSFVRSPETFIFLTPGTTGPGTNSDHASSGVFESKLSGGQNFGTEILLDGISVQRSDSGSAFDQTAPTVEALTEFKVTTSTPTAEFGHTSGGIESFTTKSGRNRYHGSVFELFRNEALDAFLWDQSYQNGIAKYHNQLITSWNQANPGNTANLETLTHKPRDRQNDFGGSLGGPVRIPHLYNGTDKTFFFFAWEQYRNRRGLTNSVTTLPSAAERSGDFSALLGPGVVDSSNNPVINPCNGQQVLQGQIFDPSTTQVVGGQTCRLPFANNQVPVSSKVAQNVLTYVPQPNRGGSGPGGIASNFLNPAALDHVITTQTSFRIDENLTERNKLFFSYHSREQYFLNGNAVNLPGPLEGGNYNNYYFTHYLRTGWDYTVTPSVLNHLTVGLNRVYTAAKALSVDGSDWESVLGISGASGGVFPSFSFSGGQYGIGYASLGGGNYTVQVPNALLVADSISWIHGAHSLHFGFDWRTYQYSVGNLNTSPVYAFKSDQTAFAPTTQQPAAVNTGDPFASFLLGELSSESVTVSSHNSRWNQNYYGLFVQDDYKFRKNLTLNLGLRWDVDTPRQEATGAQSVFSPTADNPLSPGQPGAFIYGKNATGAKTYYKDFGPRIGFAWAPGFASNTVLRGGYSIYYAQLTYGDFGMNLASGTTVNQTFQGPSDNFTPVPQGTLDSGFPAFTPPSNLNDPARNAFTFNGADFAAPEYGRPGMVQNWDLEIQHQLASDLILSVGYVGQHATRLRSNLWQPNTPNPKYNSLGGALNFAVDGSDGNNGPAILSQLGVSVPSWFVPGWQSAGNATIGQLLRPFPQYWTISSSCCLENLGQSTYNGLQAKLERRFRNGFNLLASYTFSKTITDSDTVFSSFTGFQTNSFGAQNPYNLKAEKQLSYQDVPHILVLSYLYEPPVGPGKKYLNHGVASKVLGGWQIGGVMRYQSGSPAAINQFATSNPYSGGNYRYSRIAGQPLFGAGKWSPAQEVNGLTVGSVSGGTASFNGGWNSGCSENGSGVFQPNSPQPSPVNCSAYLNPSDAAFLTSPSGQTYNAAYVFGNLPTVVGYWRGHPYYNEDFSIIKRTTIAEGKALSLKFDIPNAFNRHTLGTINGNPGDPHFGVQGFTFFGGPSSNNGPRDIQITARFEF